MTLGSIFFKIVQEWSAAMDVPSKTSPASTRHCGPPLGLGFARASTKRPFRFSQTIFHASVFSGWRMHWDWKPWCCWWVQKSGDHQLDMVNIPSFKGFHTCQVVSTLLRKKCSSWIISNLSRHVLKTKNQTVWKHPGSLTLPSLKLSLGFEIPLRMNGWNPPSLSFWAFWSVDLPGWLGLEPSQLKIQHSCGMKRKGSVPGRELQYAPMIPSVVYHS